MPPSRWWLKRTHATCTDKFLVVVPLVLVRTVVRVEVVLVVVNRLNSNCCIMGINISKVLITSRATVSRRYCVIV